IVATGEPFILLKYASMLSRRYSIPWIADYRDGWNTNQEKKSLSLVNKIQLWMHRRFEASLLKNVSMATTAAPAYSDALQNLPYFSYPVKTIFNGYDNHTIDNLVPTLQHTDLFEIAYAGIFYDYQQVETFLSGYQMFIEQHQLKPNQTKAVFYGIEFYDGMKQRLYANESLRPYIRSTARLPYNEVLNELQKAHVLLILSQKGANWLSAKLFDYMAVKRKVLLVENDHGILESIIQECNAGVTAEDPKDVCDHLTSAYHIFLNTGGVKQESKNISTYSRKAQAEAFANVLKQYCN
ncbi:MAG: glycosyltransferase family 4 protein, partial [Bacteroidetes bacterium]|nr:glycosyltransferase family 4 protein [Bacteroidota bacterium]